jgi:sec-independent protein translocase protein TatA
MAVLGFLNIGPWELLVAAIIGLLLFGRRLPEVGRSLGRGIVEFKKGLKDVKDDLDGDANEKGQGPT